MNKPVIICIDDQRQILAALQKDLEFFAPFCEIQLCESAPEAAQLLEDLHAEACPIAVLICDHVMPGKNGIDFLLELAQDERFIRIKKIMLTGMASHSEAVKAVNEAGVHHYLEKPWLSAELISSVKILLTQFIEENAMDYEPLLPVLDSGVLGKIKQTQK